MKKTIFTGSGVAIVTPFNNNGIDYPKLGELIDWQIEKGTNCIVICGTTGEASVMPDKEHVEAIAFACEHVAGRVPVVAGTGSNHTVHAVELSKEAKKCGADGILSVTPYYNKTTQEGLYRHFIYIADRVDIPMILYNVPGRTNLNMDSKTIARLAQHENIYGIKECNINQVGEIVASCPSDFTVYSGEDGMILPLLALGGKGVISVMANIIPAETRNIVDKFFKGDIEGSREIQLKVLGLIKALFTETSPIPIKAAMNLMGFDVGECRLPLVPISESALNTLRKEMQAFEIIY